MKLIEQSYEIIDQTDFSLKGIKKFIERCGRVCYKSEGSITDNSYERFVDDLIRNKHSRPLEFGTVYLKMPSRVLISMNNSSVHINPSTFRFYSKEESDDMYTYITTNYRIIIDSGLKHWLDYLVEPDWRYHYHRHTVHFTLSRGVLDEFRTHVTLSHLAESTRYCNFSKAKFGKELTFIKPEWYKELESVNGYYMGKAVEYREYCKQAEEEYLRLIEIGLKPQEARDVLPLGLKSELISCGYDEAWDNFFYRRDDKAAHPAAYDIAHRLNKDFELMKQANGYKGV